MISAELLSDLEACQRRGYYSRDWLPRRLHPTEITRQALYRSLCAPEGDIGEVAGSAAMELCATVGLDLKETGHLYDIGLHHAAIADLVATWARKRIGSILGVPVDQKVGSPRLGMFLPRSGGNWDAWYALCWSITSATSVPSPNPVLVHDGRGGCVRLPDGRLSRLARGIRGGKRHSAWSKGLLHPRNRQVRFKNRRTRLRDSKKPGFPCGARSTRRFRARAG